MTTQYECQACGWIYPPQPQTQLKHINSDIMSFEELPDSFSCPLCGVGKAEFCPVDSTHTQLTGDETTNHKERTDDVVIVGAGLAGWAVADALRAKDADIGITLITADDADRYHKPMLSVAFSQNKTAADLIRATGQVASEQANITLLAATRVQAIDSQTKIVTTDKGDIAYGNLVLATGATPAVPPCFDTKEIWHINDIGNFSKLQQALASSAQPQHIAVVGAGMVGTEIAEDLVKAGHQVTLLDMNSAPLAAMLPPIVTGKIKEALTAQGVRFIGNARIETVTRVPEGGYLLSYQLSGQSKDSQSKDRETGTNQGSDSQKLSVDHILMSTGLKVLPELPKSAGIAFDALTGISVAEESLQTSVAHIYAIGDCMSIGGVPCRYVAPLRAQATTIADHILGQQQSDYEHKAYRHKPPMIRLKNKSISVSATGTPRADESQGEWRVVSDTQSEVSQDMVLEQVTESGEVVATVTVKQPVVTG